MCPYSEVASFFFAFFFFFLITEIYVHQQTFGHCSSQTKLFLTASCLLKPKIRTDSNSLQQSGLLSLPACSLHPIHGLEIQASLNTHLPGEEK